jgi:hypothetical protein
MYVKLMVAVWPRVALACKDLEGTYLDLDPLEQLACCGSIVRNLRETL